MTYIADKNCSFGVRQSLTLFVY